MKVVVDSLHDLLAGDVTLVALLPTYRTTTAIFSGDDIPEDAPRPVVFINGGAISDLPDGNLDDDGGHDVEHQIDVFTDNTGDAELVSDIADRVRAVVHRAGGNAGSMPVVGFSCFGLTATGPILGSEGRDAFHRIVTARARLTTL